MEKERRDLVSLKPRPINSNWLWHTCGLLNDWFLIDFSLVLSSHPLWSCQVLYPDWLGMCIASYDSIWHFKPEYTPPWPNPFTHYFMCSGMENKLKGWAVQSLHSQLHSVGHLFLKFSLTADIDFISPPVSLRPKDCALLKSAIDRQPNNFPPSCKPMRFIDICTKPKVWKQANGFQSILKLSQFASNQSHVYWHLVRAKILWFAVIYSSI